METTTDVTLTETSEPLLAALGRACADALGKVEPLYVEALHTGGGCMVAAVDLSQDGRMIGRQAWLTREEGWILGFYDFAADVEDEGVCVELWLSTRDRDNPHAVADAVARILARLGVTLQGA